MTAKQTAPAQNLTLERLRSLYELIGRMNSVYDLPKLLAFVVDQALSLTGGKRGLLLLSEGYPGVLKHVAVARGQGLESEQLDQVMQFVSTTVIKDVLAKGEPRLVLDLPADSRYEHLTSQTTLTAKGVRSVLAVPLKTDDHLVGLIYIDHPHRAVFGPAELDFLSAFAAQAAQAINRARLHQRQLDDLTLLNDLSRSVVQVLDLDQVLTRIVNEAIEMLNVETGSVLLLDEPTGELYFATSVSDGRRVSIPTRLKQAQGVAGWVMSTFQPACVNHVTQDPRWFGEVETGFTTRSLLCVPLHLNGQALGVLQALNKKSLDGFDSADIARLSAFATWATVAIQNARLFQEASQARQLSALNELALALGSTLDVDTVLNIGLSRAVNLLRADAGAINLDGDESTINRFSTLVTQGFSGPPPTQAVARLSAQILAGDKSDALIVDKSRPTNLPEARALLAETGTHALALIPLPISYGVQGTLVVLNRHPHHYTPDESNLLISITRIIGLAVQNALHYSQMRAQAMHLTYLNDVGSALISSLNLAHVLRVIIQGVNAMLETERTSVFLIDSQTNELVLRYSNEGDANIRLPAPWQGIAGWVATHDKPTLVNDTLSDPRHLRQVALDTGYEAQSILCVPLKVEGEVIGVVEVLNKTGGQQFTHYHQVLLVEFTRWAAIAIHNARLFDERGRAYQHLAAEQERRIAAETRGAMAAVILDMAHTMNNIVGAIRVWATNLEQAAQAKPESTLAAFKKEVGRIRRNAEEAIRLIGTMTGPLEQPALAPTNVNTCLAAAIESCWWPDNVSLAREDAATLPPVKANAKRLEAVFHNLLSNAVQVLAPYGGQVRVCTRLTPAGAVEIAIADNGPGIPPGLQNQLFTPGVSGTDGGLGIGLWLVETFVHQFEGRINFTTSDTQGTTFFVTLLPAE